MPAISATPLHSDSESQYAGYLCKMNHAPCKRITRSACTPHPGNPGKQAIIQIAAVQDLEQQLSLAWTGVKMRRKTR